MFDITNPIYNDANNAREHLESIQWPDGPHCPHCGNFDSDRIKKLQGKSTRPGVYKCNECRKPFSVTVGTVFERSKVPLNKWVLASHLIASSKKGISSHQLHRMLGVTYKTAWFMAHRIREAMKEDVKSSGPLGGKGKTVEADETYFGKREDGYISPARRGRPYKSKKAAIGKRAVVALVERGDKVRSSTPNTPRKPLCVIFWFVMCRVKPISTPMNLAFTRKLVKSSTLAKQSNILLANMFVMTFTPTQSKVSFQSSSAA